MRFTVSLILLTATLHGHTGVLRDSRERAVGRFTLACTKTRCAGTGRTADGRLTFGGPAGSRAWPVSGRAGAYRGARGTLHWRDLGAREDLIALTLRARSPLHVAVVRRFARDARFIARADRACAGASRRLAALPPFPFSGFDPLHPDPALLPQVGAYFTGPGDPRPALRALAAALQGLGAPPANRGGWRHVLQYRAADLAVRDRQDAAALAADAAGFRRSALDAQRAFARTAVSATAFGAMRCVI